MRLETRTIVATMTEGASSPALARAIGAASVLFITALTAAASQVSVPLPFTPVPLTLQPMVVVLGGAVLGARLGMFSQILYLAAGMAGLPVFAASPILLPGVARLLGPTAGYLWSYPLAALVAGALAQRGFDRRYMTAVLAMAAGLGVLYGGGVLWLAVATRSIGAALAAGFWPFVAADLVKVLAAGAILPGAWRLLGAPARHD
jgi:biotin transport system substrate-specific component